MAAKVFLSYRREDSAGYAGRIQDRLAQEFGRDLLFMDVDTVPLGVNFVTVLHNEVAKCEVLLAVIGPHWLDACNDAGKRRLDDSHDFVRIEIGAALQRNIPVIPILLDGAKVPKANQLPKDLEELSLRNGLDVRHASFHNDIDKLVRSLKGQLAETDIRERRSEDEHRQQKVEEKRRLDETRAEKRGQDEEQRKLENEAAWAAKKALRETRPEQVLQRVANPWLLPLIGAFAACIPGIALAPSLYVKESFAVLTSQVLYGVVAGMLIRPLGIPKALAIPIIPAILFFFVLVSSVTSWDVWNLVLATVFLVAAGLAAWLAFWLYSLCARKINN
jgi:TIR domain-containing protein